MKSNRCSAVKVTACFEFVRGDRELRAKLCSEVLRAHVRRARSLAAPSPRQSSGGRECCCGCCSDCARLGHAVDAKVTARNKNFAISDETLAEVLRFASWSEGDLF